MSHPMTVLIVDDEPLARKGLRIRLQAFDDVAVVGECGNGREAIRFCQEETPQLVFLDIQMPGMNGFDVIRQLQGDSLPLIVFVTAFDQYAVDAFEVHAIDYLLKPVEEERLALALEKVRLARQGQRWQTDKAKLLAMIGDIIGQPEDRLEAMMDHPQAFRLPQPDILPVRDGANTTLIPIEDIDWVEAAGDYMCLHAGGETHIMRSTMAGLEAQLPASLFHRVHRSTLVNRMRIRQILTHMNGEYVLVLACGERIKTGRAYKDKVKGLLQASGEKF